MAEGWPPSQIVAFDNSGSSLSDSVPLNYTLLLAEYKVAVFRLRVRLTFAQLQNFWLDLAKQHHLANFYWAHQDIVVRSYPQDPPPNRFFYQRVLREQALLASKDSQKWAFGFYHYDHVSHVNVRVADRIGLWDDTIPYYYADCDYYGRARDQGLVIYDYKAGEIYDVALCLQDVDSLLLSPATHNYTVVTRELQALEVFKLNDKAGRNTWQQESGKARHNLYAASQENYGLKWGTYRCDR